MKFHDFERIMTDLRRYADLEQDLFRLGVDMNLNTDLWNSVITLFEELYPESKDDLAFFCWEADFGRNFYKNKKTDELGRECDFSSSCGFYGYVNRRAWYMKYCGEPYNEPSLLAVGHYYNIDFWIYYNGIAPCVYFDMTGIEKVSEKLEELVHGGVTFRANYLPFVEEHLRDDDDFTLVVGWDYAHSCDFQPKFNESGKRWSTYEILMEVKEVIERLVKS